MPAEEVSGGVTDSDSVDARIGNSCEQSDFSLNVIVVNFVLAGVDVDVDELADVRIRSEWA